METVWCKAVAQHGMTVRYEVFSDGGDYGLRIVCGGDVVEIPALTTEKESLLALADAMARGFVTPVTARDVAEDWLLR